MKYKLTLPLDGARTHEVLLDPKRPIFLYNLDSTNGMPPGQTATLANTEAFQKPPIWRFRRNNGGEWKGDYSTAEEALAALDLAVNEAPLGGIAVKPSLPAASDVFGGGG